MKEMKKIIMKQIIGVVISLCSNTLSKCTHLKQIKSNISKKSFKVDQKGLIKFALSGVIIAIHWITFFKAIKVSNVSVALVTMSTGAFFASLIEPIFFKRKIKTIEILLGIDNIYF